MMKKIVLIVCVFLLLFSFPVLAEEKIESAVFKVSQGKKTSPIFYNQLTISPFKVRENQIQYFSVWCKDPKGVKEVIGFIETDKGKKKIIFKLVEGNIYNGKWEGKWRTKNISKKDSYSTEFLAVNKEGKTTKFSCIWYRR